MRTLLAAGLALSVVAAAAGRPLEADRPVTERPAEPDRPRARPLEIDRPAANRPLVPGWVAADARWLVHLDLNAFKRSAIGTFVLEHPDEFDLHELDEFEREVGMSLLHDFMSFTLYGRSDDPEHDGVIVAVTTARADEALARLMDAEALETTEVEVGGFRVHVLDDGRERHYLHVRPAERRDRRIVVLAEREQVLLDAVRVIAGAAPGLQPGRSALLGDGPHDGSIVFLATRGGDLLGVEPASEILRLSDGVTVDLGEMQGRTYGEATVSAASETNAANIADVVKGMIALGRLVAAEEPEARPLADLADTINVTVRDRRITVRLMLDTDQIMEVLGILDEL